jgi:hypothetical protein
MSDDARRGRDPLDTIFDEFDADLAQLSLGTKLERPSAAVLLEGQIVFKEASARLRLRPALQILDEPDVGSGPIRGTAQGGSTESKRIVLERLRAAVKGSNVDPGRLA